MAEIDKTWVTREQYELVRKWAYEYGSFEIPVIGFKDEVKNYIHEYDKVPEYAMLWNTPSYFDVFLRTNCPFDFIQTRLMEQYGDSYNNMEYGDPYLKCHAKKVKIEWFGYFEENEKGDAELRIFDKEDLWLFYCDKNKEQKIPEYFFEGGSNLPFGDASKYYYNKTLGYITNDILHFDLPVDYRIEIDFNSKTITGIVRRRV